MPPNAARTASAAVPMEGNAERARAVAIELHLDLRRTRIVGRRRIRGAGSRREGVVDARRRLPTGCQAGVLTTVIDRLRRCRRSCWSRESRRRARSGTVRCGGLLHRLRRLGRAARSARSQKYVQLADGAVVDVTRQISLISAASAISLATSGDWSTMRSTAKTARRVVSSGVPVG